MAFKGKVAIKFIIPISQQFSGLCHFLQTLKSLKRVRTGSLLEGIQGKTALGEGNASFWRHLQEVQCLQLSLVPHLHSHYSHGPQEAKALAHRAIRHMLFKKGTDFQIQNHYDLFHLCSNEHMHSGVGC